MRGEPGDAMARMKRWDAVRQRLANATHSSDEVVDEVIKAVSEVVQRHDSLTVTVTVDDSHSLATARVVRLNGEVQVTRLEPRPAAPEPAHEPAAAPVRDVGRVPWPVREAETLDQTAARLAELIRQDPSLLDNSRDDGATR
jgi:hypothetical protein